MLSQSSIFLNFWTVIRHQRRCYFKSNTNPQMWKKCEKIYVYLTKVKKIMSKRKNTYSIIYIIHSKSEQTWTFKWVKIFMILIFPYVLDLIPSTRFFTLLYINVYVTGNVVVGWACTDNKQCKGIPASVMCSNLWKWLNCNSAKLFWWYLSIIQHSCPNKIRCLHVISWVFSVRFFKR